MRRMRWLMLVVLGAVILTIVLIWALILVVLVKTS